MRVMDSYTRLIGQLIRADIAMLRDDRLAASAALFHASCVQTPHNTKAMQKQHRQMGYNLIQNQKEEDKDKLTQLLDRLQQTSNEVTIF